MSADILTITKELEATLGSIKEEQTVQLVDCIQQAKRIFIAGRGRSGLMVNCFAMRLMHMGKKVFVVGEIVTPSIEKGDLLLIASGSGETGSLVSMAKKMCIRDSYNCLSVVSADRHLLFKRKLPYMYDHWRFSRSPLS